MGFVEASSGKNHPIKENQLSFHMIHADQVDGIT